MTLVTKWLITFSCIGICIGSCTALFQMRTSVPEAANVARARNTEKQPALLLPQAGNGLAADMLINDNATRMWFGYTTLPNKPLSTARTAVNWRMVGSTTVGTVTAVLILFEGSSTLITVPIEAPLPGGAILVGVNEKAAIVRNKGQLMELPFTFQQ
jgi:hypothetical protein